MHLNPFTLAFSGGDGLLENEFLDDHYLSSLKEIRASVVLGAVIIALFAVVDSYLAPAEKFTMWTIRFAVLIPMATLLLLLSYWKGIRRYFHLAQVAVLVITGAGCIAMILRAAPEARAVYSSGLILIVIFGCTVLRLRFIWGTGAAWTIVMMYELSAAVAVIGMIASYSIERDARKGFFLRKQLEKGREDVRRTNDELETRVRERTEVLEHVNAELTEEIAGRHKAEEALQNTVLEKEMLLKELQHRVKNNLAIISSLLGLEMRKITDEKARQVFREAQTRIYSMSTLYDQLFSSGDPGSIDLRGYLDKLAATVFRTYIVGSDRLSLSTELARVSLDVKRAVPLGLIVNELLTNAVKYAFPGERAGEIRVELLEEDGRITLAIADNGVGLPPGFDMNAPGSMGLPLVKMLCEQIGGEMTLSGTPGNRVSVTFTR
jgi:two-component sensor histidine kinase